MTNYSKTMRKYRVTDDPSRSRVEVHTFSPCKTSSSSTNSCLGCCVCLAWIVAVFFMALFFFHTTRYPSAASTTTATNTRYAFIPVQWIFHDDINYREDGLPIYGGPAVNEVCVGDQLVAGRLFPPFLLQPLDPSTTTRTPSNNNKHLHRVLRVHSEDCDVSSSSSAPKKRSAENVSANEVLYRHKSLDTLPPPPLIINTPNEEASENFSCCQSTRKAEVRVKDVILETRKSRDLKPTTTSELLKGKSDAAGLNEFQAQLLSFLQTRNSKESENETLNLLKNKFQTELAGILNLLAMNRVKFTSTSSATNQNSSTEDPDIGTSSQRKSRSWSGNSSSSETSCSSSSSPWIWPSSTETKRKEVITTKKMVKPDWSFLVADYKVTFKPGPAKPNYSTVKATKKIPPWLLV